MQCVEYFYNLKLCTISDISVYESILHQEKHSIVFFLQLIYTAQAHNLHDVTLLGLYYSRLMQCALTGLPPFHSRCCCIVPHLVKELNNLYCGHHL